MFSFQPSRLAPYAKSLFLLLLCFFHHPLFAAEITEEDYRLGASDLLQITVFGEEDLSVERRVNSRGTISYPLLGKIHVQGMTVNEVEDELTNLLKGDYLVNPKVNVVIKEYRKFYVRGEVKDPGAFPYVPGLTLDKAIAIAGGFTERASQKNLTVSREQADGTRKEVEMKLEAQLMPGDIVIVKESFF